MRELVVARRGRRVGSLGGFRGVLGCGGGRGRGRVGACGLHERAGSAGEHAGLAEGDESTRETVEGRGDVWVGGNEGSGLRLSARACGCCCCSPTPLLSSSDGFPVPQVLHGANDPAQRKHDDPLHPSPLGIFPAFLSRPSPPRAAPRLPSEPHSLAPCRSRAGPSLCDARHPDPRPTRVRQSASPRSLG